MRVAMEFVEAQQRWNPNTKTQSNFLVMLFAGREYVFEVTEEEMASAIREACDGDPYNSAPIDVETRYDEEQPEEDPIVDNEDEIVQPPPMFRTDTGVGALDIDAETPAHAAELSATDQRKQNIKNSRPHGDNAARQKLRAMKEKARSVPMRRVAKDDMGYPEGVAQAETATKNGGANAPEVEIRVRPAVQEADEDGFGQA